MRATIVWLARLVGVCAFVIGVLFAAGVSTGQGRPMCTRGAVDTTRCDVWTSWLWQRGVRDLRILAPDVRVCGGVALFGFALMCVATGLERKKLSESTSHGSARFATTKELRRYGYSEASPPRNKPRHRFVESVLGQWHAFLIAMRLRSYLHLNGIVIGMEDTAELQMYLGSAGTPAFKVKKSAPLIVVREHHLAVEGPPGSGKDVSIAIPALWYDVGRSVVVLDPKGDQFEATAGTRSAFSIVMKFAPTEPDSDRCNPLCVVPVGTEKEVTEAERIANVLLVKTLGDVNDPSTFYSKSAQPLLAGAILYALNKNKGAGRSLPGAFDILNSGGKQTDIVGRIRSGLPKSAQRLNDMLGTMAEDKKVLPSMFTTCVNALDFCRYPDIRRAISESDFVPTDLSQRDTPFSVYLVVPFQYAEQLRPLMRLMLNMFVSSHTKDRKHGTCYYLNEFPSVGAIPAIPRAAAEIRSFGVQFALFWQSEGQIMATYGKDAGQTILDVCRARVLLGASGRLATENASAMVGKTTLVRARETKAVSVKSLLERTNTTTSGEGEQARELLTADEVRTLSPDKALVFLPYLHPYLAKRCVSYSQARFRKAAAIKAPLTRRAGKAAA